MYEHGSKKNVRSAGSGKVAAEAERRNSDRHIFTASAEVVELSSGARFTTRTTDLGPGGCFVDTMLPFPVGAKVRVGVSNGQTKFETGGVVVYSQTGLGMGIAFDTLQSSQREALDTWLADLAGTKQSAASFTPTRSAQHSGPTGRAQTPPALMRLVQLMISKGILTEAEGASILFDPLL